MMVVQQCIKLCFEPFEFRGAPVNTKPEIAFVQIKKVFQWGEVPNSFGGSNPALRLTMSLFSGTHQSSNSG
jgi:hypothetical protein